MENISQAKEDIAKKLQHCLSELGLKPEYHSSEHEAIIAAQTEIKGETLKVMAFISTREVKPSHCGAVGQEIAKERLLSAAIRPTLVQQTAASLPKNGQTC